MTFSTDKGCVYLHSHPERRQWRVVLTSRTGQVAYAHTFSDKRSAHDLVAVFSALLGYEYPELVAVSLLAA